MSSPQGPTHPENEFLEARQLMFRGDIFALSNLLRSTPELVSARAPTVDPPYDGYFSAATLLHHIAGNPRITALPENIVDVGRLLLEAGADPNSTCGGGPSQPGTAGGTALGLVASSSLAVEYGFAEGLIDLLLEYGAEMDPDNTGGLINLAFYHNVENPDQRDVATALYARGHMVDFCYAAGLGLLDYAVEEMESRGIVPGESDKYYRHQRRGTGEASQQEIVQDAFLFACINGRIDVADYLRTSGVDLNAFRPWGAEMVTALHGAAWAGRPEVVKLLVIAGADTSLVDPVHRRSPLGWAIHCQRGPVIDILQLDAANMDLVDALELDNVGRFFELLGETDINAPLGESEPGVLLRTAVAQKRKKIVRRLMELGADASLPNKFGKTARDWARDSGDRELITILRGG